VHDHRFHGLFGSTVEDEKLLSPLCTQSEDDQSSIVARWFPHDQALVYQRINGAAKIPFVDVEKLRNPSGSDMNAMREFVQNASFGQREWAVEDVAVYYSNNVRVEPVEGSDVFDCFVLSHMAEE